MSNLKKQNEDFIISTTMEHRSIFELHRNYQLRKIKISPLNMRNLTKSTKEESALIESILLGIPIPPIYIEEIQDGTLRVIAGSETLTTIIRYMEGDYILREMKVLHDLKGASIKDLPVGYQRRIGDYSVLTYVLRIESDETTKVNIYRSINKNLQNIPFSYHEERRYKYYNSKGMHIVYELANSPVFERFGISKVQNTNEELILSFLSFYFKDYQSYKSHINKFLDDTLENFNEYNYSEDIVEVFINTLHALSTIFDEDIFKKNCKYHKFNRALFEVLMVSIAKSNIDIVLKNSYYIKEGLRNLMKDDEFSKAISNKIYDKAAVHTRFAKWFNVMEQYMEV